jgi:hypothetical protein
VENSFINNATDAIRDTTLPSIRQSVQILPLDEFVAAYFSEEFFELAIIALECELLAASFLTHPFR